MEHQAITRFLFPFPSAEVRETSSAFEVALSWCNPIETQHASIPQIQLQGSFVILFQVRLNPEILTVEQTKATAIAKDKADRDRLFQPRSVLDGVQAPQREASVQGQMKPLPNKGIQIVQREKCFAILCREESSDVIV